MSTPAWSQSSVSVGGLLDVGVFRDFDHANQLGTIQRSNVAFLGIEDLGGGLKAAFRLSSRLEMDSGRNEGAGFKPFWHDESTIGLTGGWGAVRLGRALTAMWVQDWKFDLWDHSTALLRPPGSNGIP